jgi:hypothetical protein
MYTEAMMEFQSGALLFPLLLLLDPNHTVSCSLARQSKMLSEGILPSIVCFTILMKARWKTLQEGALMI